MGLSRVVAALSFKWLSKAWGNSRAPGGAVLLLGLPLGVLAGSMKLFLLIGVEGRPRSSLLLLALALELLASLPPLESMLDMKLAMFCGCGALMSWGLATVKARWVRLGCAKVAGVRCDLSN